MTPRDREQRVAVADIGVGRRRDPDERHPRQNAETPASANSIALASRSDQPARSIAILRGSGGNAIAIERAGWSLLEAKAMLFALAGVFGVLSGMALVGITTSADANIGNGYTLLSIAGVILGGGEFVGGKVSPIGAVLGALTMAMAASPLLTFMRIPPDWQVAANGAILIVVLAARVLISRSGTER